MADISLFQVVIALLNGGALGVIGKWVKEGRDDANKALLLLKGTEEMDGNGVIPRLRQVEQQAESAEEQAEENAELLRRADVTPDLERAD